MLALSVRQPWAFAIMKLGKDVENRSFATKHRGPLLIHASKLYDHEGEEDLFRRGYSLPGFDSPSIHPGGIVGIVKLIDCVSSETIRSLGAATTDHQMRVARSPWYTGQMGWLLEEPRETPFVPYRGRLGLFEIDDEETLRLILGVNAPGQAP